MDSSLRASAFAGLGAFALSVIVAAFSRVPFGALVLRALLSGLAFAGLSYGAIMLLRRFLPELFGDAASTPYAGQDAAVGSVVDIVLPGGEAERDFQAGDAVERAARESAPDGAALGGQPVGPAAGARTEPGAAGAGDLEREVADLRSESFVSSDPGEAPSSSGAPRPSVSLDELDTLPDLDGFSDAFTTAQAGDDEASVPDASRLMGPSDSMPTAGAPDAGRDPAVLAKAVQTLLRKDQKGQL